jgi:hypothetical protein
MQDANGMSMANGTASAYTNWSALNLRASAQVYVGTEIYVGGTTTTNTEIAASSGGLFLGSGIQSCWTSTAQPGSASFACDTGVERVSAGWTGSTNGSTGDGNHQAAKFRALVHSFSIADNGNGTKAAGTLTPTSSFVEATCSDGNGCDVTMSETGALQGQQLTIVNVSANAADFADSAGVFETPAGGISLGQYDSVTAIYMSDRWIATSRSDN